MLKFIVIFTLLRINNCDQWLSEDLYGNSGYSISQPSHLYPRSINEQNSTESIESQDLKIQMNPQEETNPADFSDVCTNAGCIRGKIESGRIKPYQAFYGIPYAEPPVGELRLENAIPHRGWSGYWNATYPRSDCIQRNVFLYTQPILGSEDCLYLNVYRPIGKKDKLPVMVFIHGGGFTSFSGSPGQFGPDYLMDNEEVILVTMNYRLGMFGFLCSGDEAVKGNFGLKDQQLALKWIAANIEAFGGDPDSITLAGQSVGAASTQYHIINPDSQALFHRAIMLSGAFSFWALGNDSAVRFRQSAQRSGLQDWETASTSELAKQFKKLDALTLVLAYDQLYLFPLTPSIPLRPCIEGNWEGAFLTQDPETTWAEGRFPQKPILFGMVANEGSFAASIGENSTRLRIFSENIYQFLPIHMNFDPRYTQDILDFYFDGEDYINATNVQSYYQMFGDRLFYHPVIKSINQYRKYADSHKNPIFINKFGFQSSYTFVKLITGQDINLGVCHLDDLIYLFSMTDFFPVIEPNTPEGRMSDVLVHTVVNFVVRGEVKEWANLEPCTSETKSFCDYQAFTRYEEMDPNSVLVSISNKIDEEMIELWDKIGSYF
ncbi:juvenile hormone esterase-like [Lutzomyia longipalpis]|uniref:juvenile hormone esterase-like n=1 Tax=Lutzomyia longipalpis TaxID=7200 RepID=UPI002484573C|nr:juvenile hormone esterase-like [Lutzomyia longipalpis]